jgi:predicted Zn finger-like uncharacterized protein
MITHCPSCHTHFRVHAEQLAARAGQVRCGRCSRVFDALEHLVEESAPARASSATEIPATVSAISAAAEPGFEPAPAPKYAAEAQEPAAAEDAGLRAATARAGAEISETAVPAPARTAGTETGTASGANTFDFGPIAAAGPAVQARRWPWLLGALLLLLALIAQAAYVYRSALVVLFPQAKPHAAALCATLGCELPLPRRIELLSIEASDLQADPSHRGLLILTATIRNRAVYPIGYPHLELTLTDAQDQVVVRRALGPAEYASGTANVAQGIAPNAEVPVKLFIDASATTQAGYRLYLFFP